MLSEPAPVQTTGRTFAYEVFESYAAIESMREEWDRAVLAFKSPIYMSFDWTRVWWQYYGAGRKLRIMVFRKSGAIVGIVPIYIDDLGVPPLGLRVARLVGASTPPKVFDPAIEPQFAEEVWMALLERLFNIDRCDVFSLGPISGGYAPACALPDVVARMPEHTQSCESLGRDVHTTYHLPKSFDEYFNTLDSKERKVRRKKLRELEAAWPIRSETIGEPQAVAREFDQFAQMHTSQWQSEGRPGHFGAWPSALDYNRALVRELAGLGRVRFFKLWAGDKVVANQYTFSFGDTLFAELPARASGTDWDRFSLGCTSQIKLIEAAIAEGYSMIESGLGHYEYKIMTGGVESPVQVVRVMRKGLSVRGRCRLFEKLSWCMRTGLQKAWYRRIMPLLPATFRGSQPKVALRLDY